MKKKILITGGAGCLGSNLIEHWIPKGYEILTIDNFATGKREVLPKIKGLKIYEGSISDFPLLDNLFDEFKPQIVIHSAASYKDPLNWTEDTNTNTIGSINVAKVSLKYNVERVVNFQTALCYGRPHSIPIPIDHPTAPFTSYGISKTAGETYLLNSGLNVTSLRLANICAPRLAIGPIPTFYKRLKEGKSCFCSDTKRDFLDISDFLSLMDLLISEKAKNGIFNISTGEGSSIKDVYDVVSRYLGIHGGDVPIVPSGDDDVSAVVLDAHEAKIALGWEAKVMFEDIITNQLKWYDKYGVTNIYSHLSKPETK